MQCGTTCREYAWRAARAGIRRLPVAAGQMRIARTIVSRLEPPGALIRTELCRGRPEKIDLDVRDRLQAEFYLTGAWEPRLQQFVIDHLPPEGTFFDVGANVGLASLSVAARTADIGAQIHAFEPSPENIQSFRRSLALNFHVAQRVVLVEAAVGSEMGELQLRRGAESGHHHLVSDGGPSNHLVPVVTLSDYVREFGIERVDCVKIDVEGWELEVLSGADDLLRSHRIRAIVCEVEHEHLLRAGTSAEELMYFMLARGYVPSPLAGLSHRLRRAVDSSPTPAKFGGDVMFLPIETLI